MPITDPKKSKKGPEKRKHARSDKKILLRISPRSNKSVPEWTMVTSKNISGSGALFACGASVRRGARLSLTMYFPGHTIHCTGVVKRVGPGAHASLRNVGVSFRGLKKDDIKLIGGYAA